METNICSTCHYQLLPEWYFCPNCANPLKEKVPSISFIKQLGIYFVSFFMTPLGLVWGLKYIRSSDKKVKIIGGIAILLTVLSIVLMITVFKNLIDQYSKILNNLGNGYIN